MFMHALHHALTHTHKPVQFIIIMHIYCLQAENYHQKTCHHIGTEIRHAAFYTLSLLEMVNHHYCIREFIWNDKQQHAQLEGIESMVYMFTDATFLHNIYLVFFINIIQGFLQCRDRDRNRQLYCFIVLALADVIFKLILTVILHWLKYTTAAAATTTIGVVILQHKNDLLP